MTSLVTLGRLPSSQPGKNFWVAYLFLRLFVCLCIFVTRLGILLSYVSSSTWNGSKLNSFYFFSFLFLGGFLGRSFERDSSCLQYVPGGWRVEVEGGERRGGEEEIGGRKGIEKEE